MGTGTGIAVAVIDIGSPPAAGGIGWCVASGAGLRRRACGRDLDGAVRAVAAHLRTGPVALGFEAPTFTPSVGTGPPRSSAGAARGGRSVAASVATVVYTLRELRRLVPGARARLDWRLAPVAPGDLLLFECLVAEAAAGADREADAAAAVRRAARVLGAGRATAAAETQLFSPVGVALVRARWRDDLAVLGEPCLVVRFRRQQARAGGPQAPVPTRARLPALAPRGGAASPGLRANAPPGEASRISAPRDTGVGPKLPAMA